jgi:excisionase family DNA binding protein
MEYSVLFDICIPLNYDHNVSIMDERFTVAAEVLMTSDVAREMGVTAQTVIYWERTGQLPAIRIGARGTRLFRRSDVLAFKARRRRGQRTE